MTAFPPPPPPVSPAPPKGSGCWKWGVIGCLAALGILIAGAAGVVFLVFGAIKSTEVYRGARLSAEKDPRVIEALGAPMHPGLLVWGTVNYDNGQGDADFHFPLIGPKRRGVVHVVASRARGENWHYTKLTVTPRDGTPIDLLAPP